MQNLSIEDIKQAIHKIDLINRPFLVIYNPEDSEVIEAALADIKKFIIMPSAYAEKGKIIIVKRQELELHFNDFKML